MTKIETTGHRFIDLRKTTARCTCGATYVGDGSADLRAQHRAHKANPAAKKATARKAAPKAAAVATKATVKPRPRRAAK